MTLLNNATSGLNQASLINRMMVGAGIGLLLITLLLLSVDEPKPEWGKLWMIRPLIIVSLAGAMAGLCNYFAVHFHSTIGVTSTVAIILSVVVCMVGLFLGFVLGLDGTLWN
jgi:hypothetical protein